MSDWDHIGYAFDCFPLIVLGGVMFGLGVFVGFLVFA